MDRTRIFLAATAAATLAGTFAAASARDLSASPDVVRDSIAGHVYQNGGVSKEQVVDMQRHILPYDLRITFSEGRHNDYAADVKLRIIDATTGKWVFGLRDAGPLTDVSLPAGRYRVVAHFGGVERSARVDVKPDQPTNLYLHWAKDAA